MTLRLSRPSFSCLLGTLVLASLAVSCGPKLDFSSAAELAPGLVYTNHTLNTPWSVHILRVDRRATDLQIYSTHANRSALGISTLTEQVNDFGTEFGQVLAAVNGDFFQREKEFAGDTRGLQIVHGELISAPNGGASFWIGSDGGYNLTNVISQFSVRWPNGFLMPFGLNEDRRSNHWAVLYTPAAGASTKTKSGLELVLEHAGASSWLPLQAGHLYRTRVREIVESGDTPISPGVMVLSLKPNRSYVYPPVAIGDILELSTATLPSLHNVETAISGGPVLLRNGKHQKPTWANNGGTPKPYSLKAMSERHPRTALGWNQDYLFFILVDGRQQELSVGMTLAELSDYMRKLGCRDAMNLDGGGSSMLWCDGQILNRPSDKRERKIANSLLLVSRNRKPPKQDAAADDSFPTSSSGAASDRLTLAPP